MTRESELEQQLFHSQKMEAMGQLAGGVAHDLNNFLQVIHSSSELALRRGTSDPYIERKLADILTVTQRGAAVIGQLLAFSRRKVVSPAVIDLNQVVTDTAKMLRRLLREDIELELELAPNLKSIEADPVQITQVLVNLAVNARDAMPGGGLLRITTKVCLPSIAASGSRECDWVKMTVSDTGVGIDPKLKEKIFEPFFTTKDLGKGTGLGLATVDSIVRQCGGTISVESEPGHGSRFEASFPSIEPPDSVTATDPVHSLPEQSPAGMVLVCEDDHSVRQIISECLQSLGYSVLSASNASEAFAVVEQNHVDILIADIGLPGMSGLKFAHQLLGVYPLLRVVLMSGHADHEAIQETRNQHGMIFIEKPFSAGTLLARLRDLSSTSPDKTAN